MQLYSVKPSIDQVSDCPNCNHPLQFLNIIWMGMHICLHWECRSCQTEYWEDVPVGHARYYPYLIDLKNQVAIGDSDALNWLGSPLLKSIREPNSKKITIEKEIFKYHKKIIILNCIDNYYGHCLLKLLNSERLIREASDYGLIVLIQPFLRWMIPEGIAEIWTAHIPLKEGGQYFPEIDHFITQELLRFQEVYLSYAYSLPSQFDISDFSKIPKYVFLKNSDEIGFIWREDRLWGQTTLMKVLKRLKLSSIAFWLQNWKIRCLFQSILKKSKNNKKNHFWIAGLGTQTSFPSWIKDYRVEKFNAEKELEICQIYAKSKLVIGIHGSNMLLPSGHAGMTINLMPIERWGNLTQDMLYQESNSRLAAYRYRYLPMSCSLDEIAHIAINMITGYEQFEKTITDDQTQENPNA
jgi:hypothetical protein